MCDGNPEPAALLKTAKGQARTNVMGRKLVRFREISRRPTSAFARRPKLPRTISAFGGKADALEGGRFRRLVARSGHTGLLAQPWI
jgi:hypothetical protein